MIVLRRNIERSHVQRGKHETWHTFFPQGHPDPLASGFGVLVVLDELWLRPSESTELHLGDEEEVFTYLFKGALAHKGSTENSGVIHAGEFQRMSTDDRIHHKETNASWSQWAQVFMMSVRPSEAGLDCARERKRFTAAQRRNVLCVVASPDGRKGSLHIHQDALIYSSILDPGHHLVHELLPGRSAWLHIVCGEATLHDIVLSQGDGVGVTNEPSVSLTVQENTEILLVDLGPAPLTHCRVRRSHELFSDESRRDRERLDESRCRMAHLRPEVLHER